MSITEVSALLIIAGLTVLSLQSLQLKYVELPSYFQSGVEAVRIASENDVKIINSLEKENLGLVSGLNQINKESQEKDRSIIDLKGQIQNNIGLSSLAAASDKITIDEQKRTITKLTKNFALSEASAKDVISIINAQYMRIDQCLVIKVEPCMNGDHEIKGGHDDAACRF